MNARFAHECQCFLLTGETDYPPRAILVILSSLAKLGAEGSNRFARSIFVQDNQIVESGPSGPFLRRRPWPDGNLRGF